MDACKLISDLGVHLRGCRLRYCRSISNRRGVFADQGVGRRRLCLLEGGPGWMSSACSNISSRSLCNLFFTS